MRSDYGAAWERAADPEDLGRHRDEVSPPSLNSVAAGDRSETPRSPVGGATPTR